MQICNCQSVKATYAMSFATAYSFGFVITQCNQQYVIRCSHERWVHAAE